jgi:MFS family permease
MATTAPASPPLSAPAPPSGRHRRHHSFGFWVAALAFLLNMGFSAVPTPLYVLYQQRDHFSTVMITVVYAVYAVGVIGCLFLGGHVSDLLGRRRMLVTALLLNVASAGVFLADPGLTGLLVARVISGVSVGLTTATATVYLGELHAGAIGTPRPGRRAQVVATAANLGGIGVGPLLAGVLAQYAPFPLQLPYVVFGAALLVLAGLVAMAPETVRRAKPRPAYRPRGIRIPAGNRRVFVAATVAGVASFAVYGIFNSLVPSFLSGTLHQTSHALAGAVAFVAFAGGAVAQLAVAGNRTAAGPRLGPPALLLGLVLLMVGMWLPNLALFVIGGFLAGAGAGLVFRGALAAVDATAPAGSRAGALAGFFLGAYVGLSIPVVGLGVAAQFVPVREAMLVFVVLIATAIVAASRSVRRQHELVR